MYVRRLEIENLKCFVKTSVDLNYPGKTYRRGVEQPRLDNVNLFVGENGAGKSAVCQALCLAALHPLLATSAAGFRTEGLVRLENRDAVLPVRDDKTATIDAHLVLSSRDGGEGEATGGEEAAEEVGQGIKDKG